MFAGEPPEPVVTATVITSISCLINQIIARGRILLRIEIRRFSVAQPDPLFQTRERDSFNSSFLFNGTVVRIC